jgi:hypothetical protein
MSTATEQQAPAAADETAEPASPVLGEIVVATRDGAQVIRWGLGTAAVARGLTVAGIAAAAAATGRYLAGISPRVFGGSPQVVISAHTWEIPRVHSHETAVEALMTDVINAPGSIGHLA